MLQYQFQYYFDLDIVDMRFEAADARDKPLDQAEKNNNCDTPFKTLILVIKGLRNFNETKKSHRQGE